MYICVGSYVFNEHSWMCHAYVWLSDMYVIHKMHPSIHLHHSYTYLPNAKRSMERIIIDL